MLKLKDGKQFGPVTVPSLVAWGTQGRVPLDGVLVAGDGSELAVLELPELAVVLRAPPTVGGALPPRESADDGISTLVPYRNKSALVGYYLAIFGCLFAIIVPVLGFIMPIAAIVLGVKGRRAVRQNPKVHGTAHAWIAIIGGTIGVLLAMANFAFFLKIMAAP